MLLSFNRLSITERSKLQAEITSNVHGEKNTDQTPNLNSGQADPSSEFIVVTILAALKHSIEMKGPNNVDQLSKNLRILGSTTSSDLIALEVIWQPEGIGDVLSSEELLISYPNLEHL